MKQKDFLKELRRHNPKALDYVFDTYGNLIFKVAYSVLNNRELSEECVNVSFLPYYKFLDGHNGEFYNLERNENTIKIHYKGKPSDIIPLSDMSAWYEGNINLAISKVIPNINDENDYTLEFNNIPNDKKVKLTFLNMNDIVNNYALLDTIKVK